MKCKEHPLNILKYCKKYLWLLIFPIIRAAIKIGKFSFSIEAFRYWVRGTYFDILVLLAIVTFGFAEWHSSSYYFYSDCIIHDFGILFKVRNKIKTDKIVSVISEYKFWMRPFKALTLYIDTCSGNINNTDMKLIVRNKDFDEMKETIPFFHRTENYEVGSKPKIWQILLFSFFFSSTFSGTIYMLAFVWSGGRNLLNELEELQFQEHLNEISTSISEKIQFIPPIIITVATVIGSLWFISFVFNCLRYLNFKIYKRGNNIRIRYGIFTKRYYYINSSKLNYLDLRQTLIMKIKFLNIFSVTAVCPGYENTTTQIPVFMPVLTRKKLYDTLSIISPSAKVIVNHNKPNPMAFWTFIWQPCIAGLALIVVGVVAVFILGFLRSFMFFIFIMFEVPVLWMILVRITDIFSSGVGYEDGKITLRYSKWYKFHTIVCEASKVVKTETRQTIFQKNAGLCNMYFYLEERTPKVHKIRAISIREAKTIEKYIVQNK